MLGEKAAVEREMANDVARWLGLGSFAYRSHLLDRWVEMPHDAL